MNHIGLFEGIGGFSLAAEMVGWETIAWCEINPFGQKVLGYHFPKAKKHYDIKTTDFSIYRGQCDILTGGFPCQPYSQAGKRKGKEDERHLWPEMLRAVREIQPTYVVGENVLGLLNWNGGLVFDEVQTDLEAEGYEVFPYVLPACAVNAPHRRDRIWFIAYSNSYGQQRSNSEYEKHTSKRGQYALNDIEPICNAANPKSRGLQEWDAEQLGKSKQNEDDKQFSSIRKWENFPTQPAVYSRNDGISFGLDTSSISIAKWRTESIKAYGNAIVPQVALQIFKAIVECQNEMLNNGRMCGKGKK